MRKLETIGLMQHTVAQKVPPDGLSLQDASHALLTQRMAHSSRRRRSFSRRTSTVLSSSAASSSWCPCFAARSAGEQPLSSRTLQQRFERRCKWVPHQRTGLVQSGHQLQRPDGLLATKRRSSSAAPATASCQYLPAGCISLHEDQAKPAACLGGYVQRSAASMCRGVSQCWSRRSAQAVRQAPQLRSAVPLPLAGCDVQARGTLFAVQAGSGIQQRLRHRNPSELCRMICTFALQQLNVIGESFVAPICQQHPQQFPAACIPQCRHNPATPCSRPPAATHQLDHRQLQRRHCARATLEADPPIQQLSTVGGQQLHGAHVSSAHGSVEGARSGTPLLPG